MYQFQLSTSKGRVVGYWDKNIFNIVLLDPEHNLQPSKDHNYSVDQCFPIKNEYEELCEKIESLQEELNSEKYNGCKEKCGLYYEVECLSE